MKKMDLTSLNLEDNAFDCLFCYHVLEHIPDDRKAIRELYRVLKNGGWAIVKVPIQAGLQKTLEDPRIIDPAERLRAFGQADHVRCYGLDYRERLEEAGFIVTIDGFAKTFSEEEVQKYRITRTEDIYFCTKPAGNEHSRLDIRDVKDIKHHIHPTISFNNLAQFYRKQGNQPKYEYYNNLALKDQKPA